jgi:hypothetical protein
MTCLFSVIVLVILTASAALAQEEQPGSNLFAPNHNSWDSNQAFIDSGACGFKDFTPTEVAASEAKLQNALSKVGRDPDHPAALTTYGAITVNVYFHIITPNNVDGVVTGTQIQQQMLVLNNAYANTPFKFKLMSVDTTVNSGWYYLKHNSAAET